MFEGGSKGLPCSALRYALAGQPPRFAHGRVYPGPVRRRLTWSLTGASVGMMFVMSACSVPTPSTPAEPSGDAVVSATPLPTDSPTFEPTLPPGVPTVEPSVLEQPTSGLAGASALITIATKDPDTGGLLVGGYVTGVMEDGGECHFVVTAASGEVVDLLKSGVENNGSTSCGSATVPLSQLGTGPFTVVMRYVNSLGEVASEAVEVEIP